jgi:anti-sigma B factor antagonist
MDMKLEYRGDTLIVGGIQELNGANAGRFRDQIRSALSEPLRNIEIDMSQATFMDSSGLGALISLQKTARSRQGWVRLVNPTLRVEQILEVTHMHHIFEITRLA